MADAQQGSSKADLRQRIQGRTRRALTENLALKLISLLVAISIWAWLQREQVTNERARARIVYTWPEDLVLVNDVTRAAMLIVRGPQGIVRNLDSEPLSIQIDLSDAEEGTYTVDFTDKTVRGLPSGVDVVQVSPVGAQVELDQAMTRQVPVRVSVIGDPAEGWRREAVTVEPELVEITGPESLVRNITEVRTDMVDISGFKNSRKLKVPLAIEQRTVRPTTPGPVDVAVDIDPIVESRTFNEVPVSVRGGGWSVAPETARVVVEGPTAQVKKLALDALSVLVHLPVPVEVGEPGVQVRWEAEDSPGDKDGAVQVVLPTSADGIRVKDIRPATFDLEHQP